MLCVGYSQSLVNRFVVIALAAVLTALLPSVRSAPDVDAQQPTYRVHVPGVVMGQTWQAPQPPGPPLPPAPPLPTATPTRTPTPAAIPGLVSCVVSNVVDGDTIDVTGCSDEGRIRLILVDTPEVFGGVQCYGREASEYTRSRLLGQAVQLEKDASNTDRYGRYLRYVWIGGQLFNEQLVRDGFATLATYPPDVKYVDRIREAQQQAYYAGRGLWGEEACAEPPAVPPPPVVPPPGGGGSSPTATPTQAAPVGGLKWYTSSHGSAQYYYCELDSGWKSLSQNYLKTYPSESALLAEWAGQRVKHHSSKC